MKKLPTLLLFLFCLAISKAQVNDDFLLTDNLTRMPDNVGGKIELQRFFESHVVYPDKALKEKKEGTVVIKFILTAQAKTLKASISQSAGQELDNEALRLFKLLEWIPAEKETVKVNVWHTVTFVFDIEKYKKFSRARGFSKPKYDKKAIPDTSFAIIDRPDKTPEYYKGDQALVEYIQSTLDYPKTAKLQNIQGIVQLSFVVETDGKLSNIIVDKGIGGGCNEEAINLIGDTRWKPAVHKGKLVRARYRYAIQFSLNNTYKGNEMGEQK
jgi:TonB family protein